MDKVFKYPLQILDEQFVHMPKDAIILCVQVQRGVPCIWASCDPDNTVIKRRIITYETGNPMRLNHGKYIGTYQMDSGMLVFHVFEG